MTELEKINSELFNLIQGFVQEKGLQIVGYTFITKEGLEVGESTSVLACDTKILVSAQSEIRKKMQDDFRTYVNS